MGSVPLTRSMTVFFMPDFAASHRSWRSSAMDGRVGCMGVCGRDGGRWRRRGSASGVMFVGGVGLTTSCPLTVIVSSVVRANDSAARPGFGNCSLKPGPSGLVAGGLKRVLPGQPGRVDPAHWIAADVPVQVRPVNRTGLVGADPPASHGA